MALSLKKQRAILWCLSMAVQSRRFVLLLLLLSKHLSLCVGAVGRSFKFTVGDVVKSFEEEEEVGICVYRWRRDHKVDLQGGVKRFGYTFSPRLAPRILCDRMPRFGVFADSSLSLSDPIVRLLTPPGEVPWRPALPTDRQPLDCTPSGTPPQLWLLSEG